MYIDWQINFNPNFMSKHLTFAQGCTRTYKVPTRTQPNQNETKSESNPERITILL